MDRFVFSTEEAADYIGIGVNQMRMLVKRGEIPAARSGRNYKIPRPLLEEWIMEKARKGARI